MIYTVEDAIANWAKWCLRDGDCYPQGYPPEWPMGPHAKPYKVMVTEDEKLEEMEREREADAPWAERVEAWVHQIDEIAREPRLKWALQVRYIDGHERCADGKLTTDEINWRRARAWGMKIKERPSVDEYQMALGAAVAEIRELFQMYARGV